ncbi:serine hydrolase domain-containing protein [Streptomyces sp. NPDC058657]|uniref:serine hydrolase domain-containing protein n=1 Tax=unclassified Streptomyces TaxID=2593676 RepID=UPI003649D8A4
MRLTNTTRAGAAGLLAAAVATTAFTVPAAHASPPSTTRATAVTDRGHESTRRAMEALVAGGLPGITVQTRDDRGTWKSAAGVGDMRTGAPRGKDDRFRVASVTKMFVSTVLLQLEAEGRLDLDDTVDRWLPGMVRGNGNDGRKIKVRQLLNHSSGLFDYLADEEYLRTYMVGEGFLEHRYDTLPPAKHVKVALSHPPLFEPGDRHSYSNTNYILAGLIIEKVSGRSYESQVRHRIIGPLGLKGTSNPGNSSRMPRPSSRAYAKLFAEKPDRIDDVTEFNGSQGWADGDIISTTGDLNRFVRALVRGKLLPPEQLKAMKTTLPTPQAPSEGYGLGLMTMTTSCGTVLWGHGGHTIGSLTLVLTTEDGRRQLTLNTNGDWQAQPLMDVMNAEFCPSKPSRRTVPRGAPAQSALRR